MQHELLQTFTCLLLKWPHSENLV